MISGIKIYKADGSLKKEISKEKALKLYDEQNKENWALSPAEKKYWKTMKKDDEVIPNPNLGNGRGGIGRRYKPYKKRTKMYQHKCVICDTKFENLSDVGKFCSVKCRNIKRAKSNKVNYHKRRNSF